MDETESQIAKIVLGNNKSSSSYVHVMAEKAEAGEDELYMVAEMPMLNPAAKDSCERICLAIASTFKRAYKIAGNAATFESALSEVNEELGKLAGMGQTEWINKLNCVLAVKNGQQLHISTCGKTAAYLVRSKEYTDISCSQDKTHPLKTFENFASGKIRLGDIIIFSTVHLFNYASMDRVLSILNTADFLTASRTIIELLKQTADVTVSFGIILNLQTQVGVDLEEGVSLEDYTVRGPSPIFATVGKAVSYVKHMLALPEKRKSAVSLPGITFWQKFKALLSDAFDFIKNLFRKTKSGAQSARSLANIQNFKQMAPAKKFLLISIIVLVVAAGFSLYAASHIKNTGQRQEAILSQIKEAQTLLSNSQSSLLYKDDAKAAEYFRQAREKLPAAEDIDEESKELYNQVLEDLKKTQGQMEKTVEVEAENLGSLAQAENLISLPQHIAVLSNRNVISYNKQTGKIEDSALKGITVDGSLFTYTAGNIAAVYDGASLYAWNFSSSELGPAFSQSVPSKDDAAGLSWYSATSRVYMVDKKTQSVISFVVSSGALSNPVVSVKNVLLGQALDLAVDGNIYVLSKDGINEFQKGQLTDFTMPNLPVPFSGNGKLFTLKDFSNLYLLDVTNKSVLIIDKQGNLIATLKSNSFTNLKDLEVDEKAKVMYVLNDGSLLKLSLP